MDDKHNRFMDELLEAALIRHRSAEPPAGLEGRLLARLRTEPRRPLGVFRAPWAFAAVALVIIAGVFFYASRPRGGAGHPVVAKSGGAGGTGREAHPAESISPRLVTTPATAAPVAAVSDRRRNVPRASALGERRYSKRRLGLAQAVAEVARPAQFPTPAPLSEQEKLLLGYVREVPPEVLRASLEQQRSMAKDLQIPPLEIKPLEPDSPARPAAAPESGNR